VHETVTGTPFGKHLAVRKATSGLDNYSIDHVPTGLRMVGFRTQKLARLVANEVACYANDPDFGSDDGPKAVASLPDDLKHWLSSVKANEAFETLAAYRQRAESIAA